FGVDCSLEVMFLATHREHRKQRLGTLLCKYSIDVARKIRDGPFAPLEVKDLGRIYSHLQPRKPIETYPKICQAIWTSEGSQRIGKVLNFTVHLTVPFSDFVFDGKTYSERIGDDSAFCEVAALTL
ncbi:jg18031, partial [Pararge aegeria aegeria]